ncbi:carbamoyl-phosphate synthase small subunit [Desulfonauticus submarinus]|uniref:Carbamoyl phosphate synthase small chain n=1 Tax=Desulfonauticus submarinus TaxID=206665 RepID=A0A1G9ZI32_9BACT|nr:glutamine-hydrolyzing carbamoyl-phosphate synthase small subunit [Desulfonauticus submarinus]SDN20717.1 carbamoyl-phosphate synthase small subunit [Desulfonauticus submarinus]
MKAMLVLEDGTFFEGTSFTGHGEIGGEVIFNTGMTGYQEILTDPSYLGQIVCMTYPHIGNYGINDEDIESGKIHVSAFVVKECVKTPSNWRATQSLPDYLKENNILGIEGIDTRALTRHIRIHGAMRAIISTKDLNVENLKQKAKSLPPMQGQALAYKVSCNKPYIFNNKPHEVDLKNFKWPKNRIRLVVLDFGIKWSILRLLKKYEFEPLIVPATTSYEEINSLQPDAIFLSNGPGDPEPLTEVIQTVKKLSENYPLAGICLGHQILGLALGGKCFKLKFGHHALNHPVKDLATNKIEISSQNHGFCVDISELDFLQATHINLNDNTLEGFKHKTKPIIAVQHHPEAGPGPHDCQTFFAHFKKMVKKHIKG